MSNKPTVTVTDVHMTVAEVVRQSVECGADKVCHTRHGIQFFNVPVGYYTEEQIEGKMIELQKLHAAASDILRTVPKEDHEGIRKTRESLDVLLTASSAAGILTTIS